jgi:hypothetical protein
MVEKGRGQHFGLKNRARGGSAHEGGVHEGGMTVLLILCVYSETSNPGPT